MGKEAYDDYKRYIRDKEANSQRYLVLSPPSKNSNLSEYLDDPHLTVSTPSSSLRVGDLIKLEKNQRVPADVVLLHTSDSSGTCFIRTDQLDGETDWKLRIAVSDTQKLSEQEIVGLDAEVYADAPMKDIHTFVGTFTLNNPPVPAPTQSTADFLPLQEMQHPLVSPLTAENILWA